MININWREIPSLATLRAFEATARHGSFSAAGKALNVTHAAITQHVRSLERELGVSLVQREGRSIILTDAGHMLAEKLNDGFSLIRDGLEQLHHNEHLRGLHVTCTPALAHAFIVPRLGQFWDQHPDVSVSLIPSSEVEDLKRKQFDIGIRIGSGKWPDVDVTHLWTTRLIVVASPLLINKFGGDAENLPLQKIPWIRSKTHPQDLDYMRQGGLDSNTPTIFIESQAASIQAVIRGLGLTFVSELVVRDDLETGALQRIPFEINETFAYFAAVPKGIMRTETRVFVDWLKTLAP